MPNFDFNTFKPSEHESQSFAPLAPGVYDVVLIDVVWAQSKAGHDMMKIVFETESGRKLWHNLNLCHPNEVASNIAKAELADICRACALEDIKSEHALIGQKLEVKVKIEGEYNRITDFQQRGTAALNVAAPLGKGDDDLPF